ncbi:MAG: hypothetical protein U9N07_03325, partial [Euryarchaeota archaeon]|nr:hypothetical protein [Euryarchaeota archaeon]
MNIIKIVIGLLFLAVTSSGLAIGDDTSGVTTYSVPEGNWVIKTDAPTAGGYGEAVVSTATNIYISRCLDVSSDPAFWRYDPDVENWEMMNTSCLPTGAFRNGAAMTWDYDDHTYALFGGRYNDSNRTLFYRYSLSNDRWEQLADTPNGQGAGDAITWSGHDDRIYAIIGSNKRGTIFACYNASNESWTKISFNPNWTGTDDGASSVWTGGEYLYALRGEYDEMVPNGDFARYHIPTGIWENMSDIPESDGVGDGASLLWIGNWLDRYSDCIFAIGGGDADEDPGYGFYRYSISYNGWEKLESLPCPVGYYVGNRLGFADGHIHYWQGAPKTERWICGGDAFCMFKTTLQGDINGDGWISTTDAVIALDLAVRGGYEPVADVNDDGLV